MSMKTDLRLEFDRVGADLVPGKGDLDVISGEDNLAQAIIHRLTTEEGELEDVGHADYGSRLYDIIGEPNNEMTRNRIRNTIRFALSQEPRIREVTEIRVRSDNHDPNLLYIAISVVPEGEGRTLSITYPFDLEGEE